MADHQEAAAPQLPEPAAQTFTDQIDADRAAIDWLLPMVPDGRERVFWSMSHKQFEQPSEGGNVRVLRVKGRVVAATICIRDDLNRTNLLRWGGTDSFRAAGVAEALAKQAAEVERLEIERDVAQARLRRAVERLAAIHMRIYPELMTVDGKTYAFRPGDPHLYLQELADRIRAIPDELAAIASGDTPT